MKSIWIYIAILLFAQHLIGKTQPNWTRIVPEERLAKVSNFWEIGNYQLMIVEPNNQVYRRKKGDIKWELCFSSITSDFNPNYRFNGQITLGITSFLSINREFSYLSNDYGRTWSTLNYSFPGFNQSNSGYLKDLAVCKYKTFSFYKDTLYVSEDEGRTRNKIFTTDTHFYSINSCENGKIYAGNWGKVFCSQDTGKTWILIGDENNGIPGRTIISNVIGVGDSLIYASTEKGLFYTKDNGSIWDTLNSLFSFSEGDMINDIVVCDSLILGYTDQSIYLLPPSVDSIKEINIDFNNKSMIKVLKSVDGKLYLGGYNGLYYSNDFGDTWLIDSVGLQMSCNINSYDYNGEKIAVAVYSGYHESNVILSNKEFNEWENLFPTYVHTNYVKFTWDKIYAGTIYCSDDTKNPVFYNLTDKSFDYFVGHEQYPTITNNLWVNGDTAFSYSSTIKRTYDKGETWDTLSPAMQTNHAFLKMGKKIMSIGQFYKIGWKLFVYDDYNNDYIYPNTSANGLVNVEGDIYTLNNERNSFLISKDTTQSWEQIAIDTTYGIEWLYYYYDGILFAGRGQKYNAQNLMYSLNLGETWEVLLKHNGDPLKIRTNNKNEFFKHDRIFYSDSVSLYTIRIEDLKTITPIDYKNNIIEDDMKINLVSNEIQITLNNNFSENISLYNLKGILLKSFNKNCFKNNRLKIDCSNFAKGIYFLKIKTKNGLVAKRVMIK